MKIKFYKRNGIWTAGLWAFKGGISSLVAARHGKLLFVIKVFTIKNFKKLLKKQKYLRQQNQTT